MLYRRPYEKDGYAGVGVEGSAIWLGSIFWSLDFVSSHFQLVTLTIGQIVRKKEEVMNFGMTNRRYNEIVDNLNKFSADHNGMPPHWILMEMDDDGIVEDLPEGIKQQDIMEVIRETGITVRELRSWAWIRQRVAEEEASTEIDDLEYPGLLL